jgi:hypothetical protein
LSSIRSSASKNYCSYDFRILEHMNSSNLNNFALLELVNYEHIDHNINTYGFLDISCKWKFEILKTILRTLEDGMLFNSVRLA